MNHDQTSAFRIRATLICLLALLLAGGCSLPRIIILNDPLSAEEHSNLGRIYEAQQKFELAAQQYRDALEKDRKYVPALLLLADLSYRTGKYDAAESAYRKAIALQPENGDLYNNLCWVYLEQHAAMDKAEELITKAMNITPAHRAYYLDTLGVVLLRMHRVPESVAALREATALLPRDNAANLSEAYAHLAEAYRARGDTALACEAEEAAERNYASK